MNSKYEEHKRDEEFEAELEKRAEAETRAILKYMDEEQPGCPLCGSGNVDVRYVEKVDWEGYWHTGDMFTCPDCHAQGEYE